MALRDNIEILNVLFVQDHSLSPIAIQFNNLIKRLCRVAQPIGNELSRETVPSDLVDRFDLFLPIGGVKMCEFFSSLSLSLALVRLFTLKGFRVLKPFFGRAP